MQSGPITGGLVGGLPISRSLSKSPEKFQSKSPRIGRKFGISQNPNF